jgi:hypothetical protein
VCQCNCAPQDASRDVASTLKTSISNAFKPHGV